MDEQLYTIYTVGEATRFIKRLFDQEPDLQNVCVKGEISNLKVAQSGHAYFTLKDEESQLSCVRFKNFKGPDPGFPFERGDEVIARGSFSVYLPYGQYQFYVREIKPAGRGELYRKFLELKDKLQSEGLFDEGYKKALPRYPEKIGLVTSATGAVVHDILRTLKRKFPAVEVLIAPAQVQGEPGAPDMIKQLDCLDALEDIDLIILARGGGSLEDLWPFNNEALARKIFALEKPIISAVGHETDFSISDFVADYRAPTPTAAAEKAVPDREELTEWLRSQQNYIQQQVLNMINLHRMQIDDHSRSIRQSVKHSIRTRRSELKYYLNRTGKTQIERRLSQIKEQMAYHIINRISQYKSQLTLEKLRHMQALKDQLQESHTIQQQFILGRIEAYRKDLQVEKARIEALEVNGVLKRGYGRIYKNGKLIGRMLYLDEGDEVETQMADGTFSSKVEQKQYNHE